MSSTNKIQGICNSTMGSHEFRETDSTPPAGNTWKLTTLVIHPGPREEVFTASEVRALLRELEEADHFGPYQHDVLAKHGLTI